MAPPDSSKPWDHESATEPFEDADRRKGDRRGGEVPISGNASTPALPPPPSNPPAPPPQPKKAQTPGTPMIIQSGRILEGHENEYGYFNRYQLLKPLGQGGFGQVWLAQSLVSDHPGPKPPIEVAIKIFVAPRGISAHELKNRELSAMKALRSDRVPTVVDWGRSTGFDFLVMQYCGHGNLHELRYRMNMLDEPTAWRLLSDLLRAVAAAHAANILHLDVKPANVLLDGRDGFMLTDFGISVGNFVKSDIQLPGLGTPGYQSPEQAAYDEDNIGMRTDLYGIGATVWASFCGFDLSSRRCPPLALPATEPATYPPARRFREHVSDELNHVLNWLLQRDPSRRPGSAAEALAFIEEKRGLIHSHHSSSVLKRVVTHEHPDVEEMISNIIDPLWQTLVRDRQEQLRYARFKDGELLCKQGDQSFDTFLLLSGVVEILYDGRVVAEESREGTFIGEIATLTGEPRTADVRAKGTVWTCIFNAAELERFVMCNPAIAIRLIRTMASRLSSQRRQSRGDA